MIPNVELLLDGSRAVSLTAMSTVPDTGGEQRWPVSDHADHAELVAATLVQEPHYVGLADQRPEENAVFISHARADVLRLLAESTRLCAVHTPPPCGAADVLRSRR